MGLLEQHLEKGYPQAMSARRQLRQRLKQPVPLLCALLLTALLLSAFYTVHSEGVTDLNVPFRWTSKPVTGDVQGSVRPEEGQDSLSSDDSPYVDDPPTYGDEREGDQNYDGVLNFGFDDQGDDRAPEHREIFSFSTRDRRYFPIFAEGFGFINPNIIPHPRQYDMWVVVARQEQSRARSRSEKAMVCTAGFYEDVLICDADPEVLEIEPSVKGDCQGDFAELNNRVGPRDARVFYGPEAPYIVYGSQSHYTCLGVWIQDARMLLDAFYIEQGTGSQIFKNATEVRRPGRWKAVEKNFFIFWDSEGKAYAHHDLYPRRVFAQLGIDGDVGEDLAPFAAAKDQVCYAKYMPHVAPELEYLQQATNSLEITLCRRKDAGCIPDDSNTFIMHMFHIKSIYDDHAVYEPYMLLFQRTAPFAIHAISQQPFWIHGREQLTVESGSIAFEGKKESDIPEDHPERFYVTSMTWKSHGQKYHGHIDDVLFLGFGVEDSRAGAVDVLAGDLLQDLAFC